MSMSTITLTWQLKIDLNGTSVGFIERNLTNILEQALDEGLVTGDSPAEIEEATHSFDPPVALTKRAFLDLSTGHLDAASSTAVFDGEASVTYATYAHPEGYGVFICVQDDPDCCAEMPPVLAAIMRYATTQGCDYILFDCDGPIDPALPSFGGDHA